MTKKAKKIKQKEMGKILEGTANSRLKTIDLPWTSIAVLILILAYSLAVWWPTRFLPYHWDSASFVVNAARDLLGRNFSPLALIEFKTAHQPGLMLALAALWKLFGENRLVSHVLMLPSLPILMFSTYMAGKKLYSQRIGVIAAFLIGTLPLTVSEYGMISPDLWMGALATASLALWFNDKKVFGTALLSLAVLVKGSAVFMVMPMFWYTWSQTKDKKNFDFKLYLLPIATLMLWFFYHMSVTGWLFNHPEVPLLFPNSMNMFVKYLVFVIQSMFGSHLRPVLTLTAMVAAYMAWQAGKLNGREYGHTKSLLLTLMIVVFYLAVRGAFVEPYSIFAMPLLILVSLWFIDLGFAEYEWFGKGTNLVIAGVLAMLASLISWQPKIEAPRDYVFYRESDLSYQDLIYVGRAAAIFSQINFPGAKIYGAYPEYYQLTEPHQGYVSRAADFDVCQNFDPKTEKLVLVFLHPYHPSQQSCRLLLDQFELSPVQRFENNGAWVEIYAYGATESAELKDSTNN